VVDGVAGWRGRLGRLLWPPRCLVCTERGDAGRDLCAACRDDLPWHPGGCRRCALPSGPDRARDPVCEACRAGPPPLDSVRATFLYGFPVDRLVPRLKFHADLAAGRLMAEAMLADGPPWPPPLALVPVPLSRPRLRARGYDQALELAKPLARGLRVPLLAGALHRRRHTAAQSTLDAGARASNLRDAFAARRGLPPHVALVDDVMTTGATLHAAAQALRQAGVPRVDAWVCARVP
jgi:ComF family protein